MASFEATSVPAKIRDVPLSTGLARARSTPLVQALARERDALALLALAGAGLALAASVVLLAPAAYSPGTPVYRHMPFPYPVALAVAAGATFLARRPRLRLFAASVTALVVALPLVVLLPHGHLHDSNRNLLFGLETLAGRRTGMYHDAFPGYWSLVGLLQHLTGASPWLFLRGYTVGVTLAYALLAALAARGVLRDLGLPAERREPAIGVSVLFLLALGPFVWVRNNVAPETYGFALSFVLLYLAVESAKDFVVSGLFVLVASALIVSHPLSPVLVAPGLLAASGWRAATLRSAVRAGARAIAKPLYAAVGILYVTWILYASPWIVPHTRGILAEAFDGEKEVTGLTRVLPGSEGIVLLNAAFLAVLALAVLLAVFGARRGPVVRFVTLWFVFMGPILAITVGGKFFSRPLLFLLVPTSLLVAHGFTRLEHGDVARPGARPRLGAAATAVALVAVALVGVTRAGYVESVDRPTSDEIGAYAYAYRASPLVYRSSLGVHFDGDGTRLVAGDPLQGGGRAYDPARADCFPYRILTRHALAYGAMQGRNEWPLAPARAAEEEGDVSILYANADALVLGGKAVGRPSCAR